MPGGDVFQEAERQLTVCNACRYCEGYCAVFPSLELRQTFRPGDIAYLANLCHDCRGCYYACMYAPPHEFAVNIPKVFAEVRRASYGRYTWPRGCARVFAGASAAALGAAGAVVLVLLLAVLLADPARLLEAHRGPGAFYQIVPYWVMVGSGLVLCCYWASVWAAGGLGAWREMGGRAGAVGLRAVAGAAWDALVVRWLRGGGPGCPYPDERPSHTRAVLHALVVCGFLAAVASTTLAAIYQDALDRMPPYPLLSAPVVLGTLGGCAMIVGTAGMLVAKVRSDRTPASETMVGMDYAFAITIGLASLSGLMTLALRATHVMGPVLVIHLGIVAALFVTAPYGKFVHAVYRFLALVQYRLEQHSAGFGEGPHG